MLVQKQKHGTAKIKLLVQDQAEAGAPAMVVLVDIAKAERAQLILALLHSHGIVSRKRTVRGQERSGVSQHHMELP